MVVKSAVVRFLVTCLILSAENLCPATCTFCPSTSQTRGPNSDAQKPRSFTTSFFPSPRAHPGVERGQDGAHVRQAVRRGARRTHGCSGGARTSSKLDHRRRKCKLGRRCVSLVGAGLLYQTRVTATASQRLSFTILGGGRTLRTLPARIRGRYPVFAGQTTAGY